MLNVKDFGASGSLVEGVGVAHAPLLPNAMTLDAPMDFKTGQGVLVHEAGPSVTLDTPVAPSVSGSVGTDTVSYCISALTRDGGQTAASTHTFVAGVKGVASGGWVSLSWAAVPGAAGYAVYGRDAADMQLLTIITETGRLSWTDGIEPSVLDRPSTIRRTPSTSPTNDPLRTTIAAGGGTRYLWLADASSSSVAGSRVQHDDSDAIQAALDACNDDASTAYIPGGDYLMAKCALLDNVSGVSIKGAGQGRTRLYDNTVQQHDLVKRNGIFSVYECDDVDISAMTLLGQLGAATVQDKKAIYIVGAVGGSRNIEVHHVTAKWFAGEAIYAHGDIDGLTFRNSEIRDCLSNGFNANCNAVTTNCSIKDNLVRNCMASTILVSCRNLIVQGNDLANSGPIGGSVVNLSGITRMVCTDNIIHSSDTTYASTSPVHLGFDNGLENHSIMAGVFANNTILDNTTNTSNVGGALLVQNVAGPLLVTGNTIAANGRGTEKAVALRVDGSWTGQVVIDGNYFAAGDKTPRGIYITAAADNPNFDVKIGTNHYASDIPLVDREIFDTAPAAA